jgi:UDP-glucose 4-epimerase
MTAHHDSLEDTVNTDTTIGILGCSGFIGSGLMKLAETMGIRTIGLSRRRLDTWAADRRNSRMIIGDANDSETLARLYKEVDVVLDCASSLKPSGSAESSLLEEPTLLDKRIELASISGLMKYIYISSGGALYPASIEKISETTALRPSSKYGLAKQLCEHIIEYHARKGALEIVSARTSNPYGYYHTSNRHGFINILIKNTINDKVTTIFGDPKANRKDYIYIDDCSRALLKLATADTLSHNAVNVGHGSTHSLSEILSTVATALSIEPKVELTNPMAYDKQQFCLDTSLLCKLTNFKPLFTLREGILRTLEWETLKAES